MGEDISKLFKEFKKRQLVELDACVHCTECVKWCPVTQVEEDYANTPMDKIAALKSIIQRTRGPLRHLRVEVKKEELRSLADKVWRCTTCGRCGVVCPVGIDCQELWPAVRSGLMEMGYGPVDSVGELRAVLEDKHNPFNFPMDERNKWMGDYKPKETAELAFFTGCELAYRTKPMATGAVKLLIEGNVDFTVSDDEWCCGFPLYILGDRSDEVRAEIEHNVEALKKTGAKRVAASCPCCFAIMKHVWPEYSGELPFEVVHIIQVVSKLVESGSLIFTKPYEGRVAYHDPCYLSRGWGEGEEITEEPRKIIRSIRGVKLVELPDKGILSRCPGSGGGLRRSNPELSERMAAAFVEWVGQADIEILLTSCPAVNERVNHIFSKGQIHPIEQDIQYGVNGGSPETSRGMFRVMDILEFAAMHL